MGAGSVIGGGLAKEAFFLLDLLDVAGRLEVPFAVGFGTGGFEGAGAEGGRSWCEAFL